MDEKAEETTGFGLPDDSVPYRLALDYEFGMLLHLMLRLVIAGHAKCLVS
jgi:hypothetical protein